MREKHSRHHSNSAAVQPERAHREWAEEECAVQISRAAFQTPKDMLKLRVVGVDPALTGATGYGVVDVSGSAASLLRYGALKMPARASVATRLCEIHQLIASLLIEFSPDAVAVEAVFTALNMRTAIKLAEVRGVVLLAAAQASIPAHSYSPREVKASIAGHGGASKEQMQQMVRAQLQLSERPEPSDAADALAVALCHAHLCIARDRMGAAMVSRKHVPGPQDASQRNQKIQLTRHTIRTVN